MMKKNIVVFYISIIILILLCCCKSESELHKTLDRLMYKPINFHNNMDYIIKDTTSIDNKHYTIIHNINSKGCTKCNLKLDMWVYFIDEINKISKTPVKLVFLAKEDDRLNVVSIFNCYRKFDIINISSIKYNIINELPDKSPTNTFLLDENNKIITIGNPLLNKKIKENYYKLILNNRL